MFLMLQNIPIMEINIDESKYKVLQEDLLPVRLRGVYKKEYPDLRNRREFELYYGTFIEFLSHRVLSLSRKNAKKILNTFRFSQSQDPITKAKIAIVCKAVSMSDDYWLNDDKMSLSWDSICVRKNHLNEIISNIALTGSSLTVTGGPETPEISTMGAYAKSWIRENDTPYLLKAGTGKREEEIEVMCSRLLDCFNVPHVPYELTLFGENKLSVSKCPVMNSDKYSRVPADEFFSFCNRNDSSFEEIARKIDSEMFYKHCIIDYLFSNPDRHMQNWGFFMNNKTGKLECIHPVFDNNNAFDESVMKNIDGDMNQMMEGKTQKEAAIYALKRCRFEIIKPITKNMFLTEEQYNSFFTKACEIGLYYERELSMIEKIRKVTKYEIKERQLPPAQPVRFFPFSLGDEKELNDILNDILEEVDFD